METQVKPTTRKNKENPQNKGEGVIKTVPGLLKVIKRNNSITEYDPHKIAIAITKAFLAVEGDNATASTRIHEIVSQMVNTMSETFQRRQPSGGILHIEEIQDQVELSLMRFGEHKVARTYVLYREERRKDREAKQDKDQDIKTLHVTLDDGHRVPLDIRRVSTLIHEACADLAEVDSGEITKATLRNLYDGIKEKEVSIAMVMSARPLIETEPNYTYVAARLLLDALRSEALSFLGLQKQATHAQMKTLYPTYFKKYIEKGIALKRLSPVLMEFDLDALSQAFEADNDLEFTYLGLQTLYDRYFIHENGARYELPQAFFMRVAMGLALNEENRTARTIEFYKQLSAFDFMSSTPTLFNSGTCHPQLSSCFLTTIPDDLSGIFGCIRDNSLLSKFAGGIGNDWTPVRAMGAHIAGTNGESQGVVPFLNVADATAIAVNQGGKRKGAVCAYLETWHLDIEEFLDLRKNTGDDRRRTHDMNTANWIPDLFMQRVNENSDWTLFSPDEVPDLHDLYGKDFAKAYTAYEEQTKTGDIKHFKTIPATKLWRKMLSMLFETGHPWLTFKDVCNLRSPQQHVGVVHSSNLCTEITLNTNADEVAVCNLGSINLPAHIDANGLNLKKLEQTVTTAIRMLDNVIDVNFYTIPQAKNSNMQHRPIGLGIMGFQDALYKLGYDYSSPEAVKFADISMEKISYFAIKASSDLAKERGSYETFKGSLWDQGILPIDSIEKVRLARDGKYFEMDTSQTMDWDTLRKLIKKQGMRNSNTLAIAPTATISNICGVSQSIEPTYQNLYVKSNMSGEFTVVNPYLVRDLKALGLWDEVMVNDLKYFNGSIQQISRIPSNLKARYATAFEIMPRWLIETASRRQKWIDQAQSLNIYMAEPSGKKLDILYRMAWQMGLKTTYYLRSMGATNAEKSTIHDASLNAVKVDTDAPKACSIDNPDCEACQ
jgi:ribonucleoside-diphosphate reductase alpha chain